MSKRDRSKSWTLVGATVFFGLTVIEIGLRALYPIADPFVGQRTLEVGAYVPYRHEANFNLRVVPEPHLPGVEGPRQFRTNAEGFVGPELAGTSTTGPRIFLVGGSTMECVALGEDHNPAGLTQAILSKAGIEAQVVNTGHSGDATFDHVAVLAHRIAHLSPRVVVFLVGINDLIAIGRGERYDHANPDQRVELDTPALIRLALTRLYVGRLAWAAVGKARLRAWNEDEPVLTTHYARAARRCAAQPPAGKSPRLDVEGFATNLRTLVATTRAAGATPVLMTQPHAWDDATTEPWWWMRCFGGRRYAPAQMTDALQTLNETTVAVAKAEGAIAVDLAARLKPGGRFMYDDVHFNDTGAKALSEAIAEVTQRILQSEDSAVSRPTTPE